MGDLDPHDMVPLAHPSPQPKQHLDQCRLQPFMQGLQTDWQTDWQTTLLGQEQ